MNRFVKQYRCTICNTCHGVKEVDGLTCPTCGEQGILDVLYDYDAMKKIVNLDYFKQHKDLTMWRYAPLLSIIPNRHDEMLETGWTPLHQARRIHEHLGVRKLLIKDEGANPSGSLKDRASAIAVLDALNKKQQTLACSSTGNAASSLACHAARMGLSTVIFVPKRAPLGKLAQLAIYGSKVIAVDGDYKQAYALSKQAIQTYGWYNRNAAINPHLVEGKKTVALEIAEQCDFKPTDWIAVSVGDGCTIAGVFKGFFDLKQLGLIDHIPRLLGVQSKGCAPFVQAFHKKGTLVEAEENTLADSIAVGIPRNPVKALSAVAESKGHWIAVSDEAILEMMVKLGSTEGIFAEPAAAAGLAGVRQAVAEGIIKAEESVTFIMTGNGLKDPDNARKAVRPPTLLKPSLADLKKHMENIGEQEHAQGTFWPDLS
ncbi:MAG: threonine synthase [Acholeplasmataceae bacterium]|nr:MAG: threonine synthase [Acholeplasmataceae bacterium]